jgi:hypothetical protein
MSYLITLPLILSRQGRGNELLGRLFIPGRVKRGGTANPIAEPLNLGLIVDVFLDKTMSSK